MPDRNLSAPLYALVTLSPNRLRATAGVWLPRCVIRASNITVFLYSHNFVQDFGETPCRVPWRSRGTKGPAVTRQTYLSSRSRQTITLPCTTLHSPHLHLPYASQKYCPPCPLNSIPLTHPKSTIPICLHGTFASIHQRASCAAPTVVGPRFEVRYGTSTLANSILSDYNYRVGHTSEHR